MVNEMRMDVVGLGALNLDLIADWKRIALDDRDEVLELFALDRERTTQDLDGLLRTVTSIGRTGILRAERGGSAFNTMRALGSMRLGLRLGYVGVAAAPPQRLAEILGEPYLPAARRALADAGIDQGGVLDGSPPGGLSVSIVRGLTRSMRTLYDPQTAALLESHSDEIRTYLQCARHIHMTSILGPGAEAFLADLLESVLDDHQKHTLSVDPGETWSRAAGASPNDQSDVGRLLELADVIFVNREELTCLAGSDDKDAAQLVLERYSRRARRPKLVLLKSVTDARSYALRGDRVVEDQAPQRVLPPSRVADATGAGDVFAAGVLAALHSDRGRTAAGLGLGLAASRRKIQLVGAAGYQDLERVLLGSRNQSPGKLFVSHSFHNEALARAFVDLMRLAGVPAEKIFCTAQRSTGPEPGRPLNPAILRALKSSVLMTMLVTPDYLKSTFCSYELGASWALGLEQFPLLVSPAAVSDLTDLIRSDLVCRIDSAADLGALHMRLHELGLTDSPRGSSWDDDVASFLQRTIAYRASGT